MESNLVLDPIKPKNVSKYKQKEQPLNLKYCLALIKTTKCQDLGELSSKIDQKKGELSSII